MVTQVALQRWIEVQDMLAQPSQAAETNLQESIDCIDGLVEKRAAMLTAMVAGCGAGGREVARGVARQTAEVKLLWPWIRAGLAKGALTSPTRTTANLLWLTLIGPALNQRTGAAPNGTTNLAAARSWLEARSSGAAGGQGGGAVRRKLAPALSQPVQQLAAPPQAAPAAQAQQLAGWSPTPNWGPPPSHMFMAQQQGWGGPPAPAYAPPAHQQLALLPPPQQQTPFPPPPPQPQMQAPPLRLAPPPPQPPAGQPVQAGAAPKDGFTGQPATSTILGDRGVCDAEMLLQKNQCAMCLRTNPANRPHASWECPIKLAKRAFGEPCPGFDVNGAKDPAAWTVDGNLQWATVQAWIIYIEKHGLKVAKTAPGPPRLS